MPAKKKATRKNFIRKKT